MLNKPFNPYLRRHTGITETARKMPEYSLRIFSGWTKTSKMPEIYTHELGDEVFNQILEVEGFSTKREHRNILKPKQCPNCNEPNKIDSKFCFKCRMVLSYDAYTEAKQDSETQRSRIDSLTLKFEQLENEFKKNKSRR